MSKSLWPHGLQHARPPCPSPTPGRYSNSFPSSRWCHPIISSSVIPFISRLQTLPASESFPMSWFFTSGGQGTGVSPSASVHLMNIQDWFLLGWTGWFSLLSKGLSRVFSKPQFKSINSSVLSFLHNPTLTSIHDHWKNHSLPEAGDIKKRWKEYTEELYKKDLHDQDNHDGVITHLEPDILECEVKWAF